MVRVAGRGEGGSVVARIRTLRPELKDGRPYRALSAGARLLLFGIITEADDDGIMIAEPHLLERSAFDGLSPRPGDDAIAAWFAELEAADFVRVYEAYQTRYLQIVGWRDDDRHPLRQKINRPTPSRHPEPPWGSFAEPDPRTHPVLRARPVAGGIDSVSTHGGLTEGSRTDLDPDPEVENGEDPDLDARDAREQRAALRVEGLVASHAQEAPGAPKSLAAVLGELDFSGRAQAALAKRRAAERGTTIERCPDGTKKLNAGRRTAAHRRDGYVVRFRPAMGTGALELFPEPDG